MEVGSSTKDLKHLTSNLFNIGAAGPQSKDISSTCASSSLFVSMILQHFFQAFVHQPLHLAFTIGRYIHDISLAAIFPSLCSYDFATLLGLSFARH